MASSSSSCASCGKVCTTLCACKQIAFCSKPCQKAGWPTHKPNCKAQKAESKQPSSDSSPSATSSSYVLSPAIRLADIKGKGKGFVAKSALKAGTLLLSETPLRSKPYATSVEIPKAVLRDLVLRLVTRQRQDALLKQLHSLQLATEKSELPGVNDAEWTHALAQIRGNAFMSAQEPGTDRMEIEVCPIMSLFNHSCAPNAVFHRPLVNAVLHSTAATNKVCLYTIAAIAEGAEVCICYHVDLLALPTRARQERLLTTHQFTCRCPRCTASPPLAIDTLLLHPPLASAPAELDEQEMNDQFLECLKAVQAYQVESDCENAAGLCRRFMTRYAKCFQPTHWQLFQVREVYIQALASLINIPTSKHRTNPKTRAQLTDAMRLQLDAQQVVFPHLHNAKLSLMSLWLSTTGTPLPTAKLISNQEELVALFSPS